MIGVSPKMRMFSMSRSLFCAAFFLGLLVSVPAADGQDDAGPPGPADRLVLEGDGEHGHDQGHGRQHQRRVAGPRPVDPVDEEPLVEHIAQQTESHEAQDVLLREPDTDARDREEHCEDRRGQHEPGRVEGERAELGQRRLDHGEVRAPDEDEQNDREIRRESPPLAAAGAHGLACAHGHETFIGRWRNARRRHTVVAERSGGGKRRAA